MFAERYIYTHIGRCRYARPAGGCMAGSIDITTSESPCPGPCFVTSHSIPLASRPTSFARCVSQPVSPVVYIVLPLGCFSLRTAPHTRTGTSRDRIGQSTITHCIHTTIVNITYRQFQVVVILSFTRCAGVGAFNGRLRAVTRTLTQSARRIPSCPHNQVQEAGDPDHLQDTICKLPGN